MSTKFFTNHDNNSLYKKFLGVFKYMPNLYAFQAVVGYFRSSGYYQIREHILKVNKVKILVGINVDHMVAEAQRRGLLFFGDNNKTRDEFIKWMEQDIKEAKYEQRVEQGILDFMQDVVDGKIELRAHKSKKLHAKIYIFLPEDFNSHSTGTVITGSSNLTNFGLGKNEEQSNYEFNVEIRDYDDVKFAADEFENLWKESVEILPEDFTSVKRNTHLEHKFTPYELFIKFLIEYFGRNIEYDPETVGDIPNNYKKLSYQVDAVNQGFNMLLDHNGFFLADVVGTGKTIVAAMLAKKFIINNGSQHTKILVVYPPALEKNWKRTFRLFNIDRYAKFISNGSLEKIIEGNINYWSKDDYDLILVDEAHKFRNHRSQMFENLQRICKAGRRNNGFIEGDKKKVVLISATPLNNKPEDIYYLLQLFQDARRSTLNINLQSFFGKIIEKYRTIKKMDDPDVEALRELYSEIRERVLKPITIRRTRKNLEKVDLYKDDLRTQNITFPELELPKAKEYVLDEKLDKLFYKTIDCLTNKEKIKYYRYQAIKFLKPEVRSEYYENAETISIALAHIMKTMLVKRLESSFKSFKISLNNFRKATDNMIRMFENDKIFVAPDLDITKLLDEGYSDEEIEDKILSISDEKPGNKIFTSKDFDPEFVSGLKHDFSLVDELCDEWEKINYDPKFDVFLKTLKSELLSPQINDSGKLVIFSESKDTTDYLTEKLNQNGYDKILTISSKNRKNLFEMIVENFDANYEKEQKNDYDILITTEVLAEGVNLHRANVIVNYDTPWNATRLMQRIGRINRIGSKAKRIYNYNFYPSAQGNEEIKLKKTAFLKLQGFHTAFGEDAKIYTLDEIIEQFEMYKSGTPEEEDIRLEYLQYIRDFKVKYPKDFKKIKNLPLKARVARKASNKHTSKSSICFLRTGDNKEVYVILENGKVKPLVFDEAVRIFEADENEKSISLPSYHFEQIQKACLKYEEDFTIHTDNLSVTDHADARTNHVRKYIRDLRADSTEDGFEEAYHTIMNLLNEGTYVNLTIELDRLRKRRNKPEDDEKRIIKLAYKYSSKVYEIGNSIKKQEFIPFEHEIIISESFE